MRPHLVIVPIVALLAACGGSAPARPDAAGAAVAEQAAAELAIARGRCGNCHTLDGAAQQRLAPLPTPALAGIGGRRAGASLATFLSEHHGQPAESANALAAWLQRDAAPLAAAEVSPAMLPRGERLFGELACRACHDASGIAGLAQRTDFAHVVQFLSAPSEVRPDLTAHDFGLDGGERSALAAWLLRDQLVAATDAAPLPGLVLECFELPVKSADPPQLDGLEPKRRETVTAIDVERRTRDNNFALRFRGYLTVPTSGDYTFVGGADDCVWIRIDDKLVVENAAIAPMRRKEGALHLDAGAHPLEIVYTESGGGQELEVAWRGPGIEQQALPASALSAKVAMLRPPAAVAAADAVLSARGQDLYGQRRCGACHGGEKPAGKPAPAWKELGDGACPATLAPAGLVAPARAALTTPREPQRELAFALDRDGCRSCHVRDGRGGLRAEARALLVEAQDIGDEGKLPPDLTRVGNRLRPAWLLRVLKEGHKARPYVHARMLRLPAAAAESYASWFAACDAAPDADVEPAFSPVAAAEGRRLAGNQGFNCITCHPFASHAAVGPQGMDLAIQFERLRPAWFRDWLLHATKLRPGTRMPAFWPVEDDTARAQADALRAWLSLGTAAPVPTGYAENRASLVLEPIERPRLHGAFLKGLSARCLAVGTAERTHYAVDLSRGWLAWLWRGAFLDADGTWSGRAGQLLEPLGDDRVVLSKDCTFVLADGGTAATELAGWDVAADGQPVFHWRLGTAQVEDRPRPELRAGGTVLVRTLSATGAAVKLGLPHDGRVHATVVGKEQDSVTVPAGGRVEVVYQW